MQPYAATLKVPQLWQVLGEMPPVNRSLVALRWGRLVGLEEIPA